MKKVVSRRPQAAGRLHVSQPGVSSQIRRLEREIGRELLDRSTRSVCPTAVGEAFLPHARAALESLQKGKEAVAELNELRGGHVSVGMVTLVAPLDVPSVLAEFHLVHPGIGISLTEGNTDDLVANLQKGEIDLAFLGMSSHPPAFLQTKVVVDDPMVAVVPANHEYAGGSSVTLRELASQRLLSLPVGSGTRRQLDRALALIDAGPAVAFSASDPSTLIQFVRQDLGVAIVPGSTIRSGNEGLRLIPLSDPGMRVQIRVAWRETSASDPALQAVIRHVLTKVREVRRGRGTPRSGESAVSGAVEVHGVQAVEV